MSTSLGAFPVRTMVILFASWLMTGSAAIAADTPAWDKTFPKSDQVEHRKVTFRNRYGITLAADLYRPGARGDRRLAQHSGPQPDNRAFSREVAQAKPTCADGSASLTGTTP